MTVKSRCHGSTLCKGWSKETKKNVATEKMVEIVLGGYIPSRSSQVFERSGF